MTDHFCGPLKITLPIILKYLKIIAHTWFKISLQIFYSITLSYSWFEHARSYGYSLSVALSSAQRQFFQMVSRLTPSSPFSLDLNGMFSLRSANSVLLKLTIHSASYLLYIHCICIWTSNIIHDIFYCLPSSQTINFNISENFLNIFCLLMNFKFLKQYLVVYRSS